MNTTGRERVERRLTAILAADAAGYSRLMGADKEGTLAALRTLRREHRGPIVKTTGDGLLVEFVNVVDAVRCAVEMQQGMAVRSAFATLTNPFAGEGALTVSASQLCR
jgi:adenylate cyclase